MYRNYAYMYQQYIENRLTVPELAQLHGVSTSTIESWLHRLQLTNIRSRVKNSINNAKISLTPEFYYFLGFVATDSYVDLKNHRISIRMRNDGTMELLEALKDYFEFTGDVRMYRGCEYDLTITSKSLIKFIEDLGVVVINKTFNVTLPNTFPCEDCARMFVRSVLEGDGYIRVRPKLDGQFSGSVVLVKGSATFIDGFKALLETYLPINPIKFLHRIKGKYYPGIRLSVADSQVLCSWVYSGYPRFRMRMKYERAKKFCKDI